MTESRNKKECLFYLYQDIADRLYSFSNVYIGKNAKSIVLLSNEMLSVVMENGETFNLKISNFRKASPKT